MLPIRPTSATPWLCAIPSSNMDRRDVADTGQFRDHDSGRPRRNDCLARSDAAWERLPRLTWHLRSSEFTVVTRSAISGAAPTRRWARRGYRPAASTTRCWTSVPRNWPRPPAAITNWRPISALPAPRRPRTIRPGVLAECCSNTWPTASLPPQRVGDAQAGRTWPFISSPTLYCPPFVANRLLFSAWTEWLLGSLAPRDPGAGRQVSGLLQLVPRAEPPAKSAALERLGYELVEYRGFFGHRYYDANDRPARRASRGCAALLAPIPLPLLTSYAYLVLRKPTAASGACPSMPPRGAPRLVLDPTAREMLHRAGDSL